ncbi:MAG: hypothetical protein II994_05080 [Lachnospiraceae bacterium]|nr:hypothetical protein [Lachnospiraceae bacterium]
MGSMRELLVTAGSSLLAFLVAGFVADRIFKNKYVSVLAGLFYTLIPYRFYSLRISRDYKEALAWVLLPILLYGAYMLYGKGMRKGISAVLWVGFALMLINLPLWMRDIRLYLRGEFSADGYSLQEKAVYPVQYFLTFFEAGENTNLAVDGMRDVAPLGIGFGLTFGVILYLWLMLMGRTDKQNFGCREKEIGFANLMLFVGVLAAFFSSNVFPWDDLRFSNKLYGVIVILVQNPARLMGIASGSFWMVTCVAALLCLDWKKEAKS